MATINQLPAKSPILDKYRSRLQITYRTNISGTPAPIKLPFRVLVLGDFLGPDQRALPRYQGQLTGGGEDLRDRKIRSIQLGAADASVPAFMKELTPWMRVPKSQRALLEAPVPGDVVFNNLTFPNPAASDFGADGTFQAQVSGTFTFTSLHDQNKVCDVKAPPIPVTGTLTVKQGTGLPTAQGTLKMTLQGAVSGTIKDLSGKPIGVLTALFASGDAPLFEVDVDVTAQEVVTAAVNDPTLIGVTIGKNTFPVPARRTIPFQSLDDFSPDNVAENIPELHRLRVLRDLVLEFQSTLKNNRDLQKAMRSALLPGNAPTILAFQAWALEKFPQLALKTEASNG